MIILSNNKTRITLCLFLLLSIKANAQVSSKKTIFELDAEIENTFYKGIPLGKVKGTGKYADKKLKFDQFTSDWEGNHISGSAILPLDFDLASKDKSWYSDGKMSVKTEGSFRSATFLSTFISFFKILFTNSIISKEVDYVFLSKFSYFTTVKCACGASKAS